VKFIRFLGSRALTLGLLITGVIYFLWLTALWFLQLIPAVWMLWVPISVLAIPFLTNVMVNLFTRRYAYTGNILFHAAFLIIFIGLRITLLTRFEGVFALTEGESFFGEESEYITYSASDGFDELAPDISLKLESITLEFWADRLHFTKFESEVRYPATTLAERGEIRINGGLTIDGARLRLLDFGYTTEFVLENTEKGTATVQKPKMAVFPPGSEDNIEVGSYRVYIKVLPDPVSEKGELRNRTMNLVDPVFLVRIKWLYRDMFEGALKKNDFVEFGTFKITFKDINYWTRIGAVKDPGEMVIVAGLVVMVLGLMLRLLPGLYGKSIRA
jgi:hypothetical protein